MNTVAGKQAVVVGAAHGIGRDIAVALADEGVSLRLVDIAGEALARTLARVQARGVEVSAHSADATDPSAVEAVVEGVRREWGGLDLLVNSAGNVYWGPSHLMSPDQWRSVLDVNVGATVNVTRLLLPLLLSRPQAHIVNVSSTAGLLGAHHRSVYSAAKAGVVGFSESLRVEYARRGLGVSVLCPGYVSGTNLFRSMYVAPGALLSGQDEWEERFTPSYEVAERALDAIVNEDGIAMQTEGEHLLWLLKRLAPIAFEWLYTAALRSPAGVRMEPPFVRLPRRAVGPARPAGPPRSGPPLPSVAGKRALVTGAASGIGRAIAVELARRGASLLLTDVNAEGLAGAAERCRAFGRDIAVHVADLSLDEDVSGLIDMALGQDIDILVNSAGVSYVGPTEAMSAEQWQRLLAVNLHAPIRLALELLPRLLQRSGAHVLNVASFGGLVPHYNETAYCLTKYALRAFSESLRFEYAGHGLGVTAICPGLVHTNLDVMVPQGESFFLPPGAERLFIEPEKVAATAVEAIERNRGVVVGGFTPHALWVLNRWLPGVFDWLHQRIASADRRTRTAAGRGA